MNLRFFFFLIINILAFSNAKAMIVWPEELVTVTVLKPMMQAHNKKISEIEDLNVRSPLVIQAAKELQKKETDLLLYVKYIEFENYKKTLEEGQKKLAAKSISENEKVAKSRQAIVTKTLAYLEQQMAQLQGLLDKTLLDQARNQVNNQ